MERSNADRSNAEWDRALEDAFPPVPPPAAVRTRVLAGATARSLTLGVLRLVVPYAAGVATVLAVHALAARPSPPAPPGVSFDSIADRAPPAPASPEVEWVPVPVEPVPRIS